MLIFLNELILILSFYVETQLIASLHKRM